MDMVDPLATGDPTSLEPRAITLLARGRLSECEAFIESIMELSAPGTVEPTLAIELLSADVDARRNRVTAHDLDALLARCRARHPALTHWAAALVAEYHFRRTDPLGLALAVQALQDAPEEALPPAPVLVGRGRLRYLAAIGALYTFTDSGHARAWALHDAAAKDLARAGWEADRSFNSAVFAAFLCMTSWDGFDRSLPLLRDSLDRLLSLRDDRAGLVALGVSATHAVAGDMPTAIRALATADAHLDRDDPNRVLHDLIESVFELVRAGPTMTVLGRLDELAAPYRHGTFEGGGSLALVMAAILLDFGQTSAASRWIAVDRRITHAGDIHTLRTPGHRVAGSPPHHPDIGPDTSTDVGNPGTGQTGCNDRARTRRTQ